MLKLIHAADIHLGSRMGAHLSREQAGERRTEICATFSRMVEYAKTNGVSAVLLSGDVFDGDCPIRRDKEFFYDVIRSAPDVSFFYLRGNHDTAEAGDETLPNLFRFGGEWTTYDLGEATVTGAEFTAENATSLAATLRTDPAKRNIVMLHGQVGDAAGLFRIRLADFAERGIDYMALGHVHAPAVYPIDRRGKAAYCGCLEGRGFDECGERGFVLLEVTDGGVRDTFVPFATRTVRETTLDVSGADGIPAVAALVADARPDPADLWRVILRGEVGFSTEGMTELLQRHLGGICYCLSVKDRTTPKLDEGTFEGDVSLKSEAFRLLKQDAALSDDVRRRAMTLILKALNGEELDR